MPDFVAVALGLLALVGLGLGALILARLGGLAVERAALGSRFDALDKAGERLERTLDSRLTALRDDATGSAKGLREEVNAHLVRVAESLDRKQDALREQVQARLDQLRVENGDKLEQMRVVVEEKLHGTLEARLGESFRLVQEQLERVHAGLGEMQLLATGVGDLKRVLSNVKTRGIWGEVQLGNLLDQLLTVEQYATNVEIVPGSGQRVEFAIRLPGRDDGRPLWLPIDAKFPQDVYDQLVDAAERADPLAEAAAAAELAARVKLFARDIATKYVCPPYSTDFAILFLPTEGLYAEVLRKPGLADAIQRDHRVTIAGPTTLGAFLNSLQMGFRTLAIEQRSSEVWQVLGAVKTEIAKFGDAFDKVKKKLTEATRQMDQMDTRKRVLLRTLKDVDTIAAPDAPPLLGGTLLDGPLLDDDEPEAMQAAE
ncbi:MAG TPA: DNA recombination protein RmuC [Candidatus Sulfotelmatobacter sp.]|nr:DNA recombination protein RmuC [Candidatus Sulfotelmatobacter sp.]